MLWGKHTELSGTRMPLDGTLQDGDAVVGPVVIDEEELHLIQRLRQQRPCAGLDIIGHTIDREYD